VSRKTYTPCCLVCYTCHLTPKPVGKREAERIATGHMNAYGHEVVLQVTTKKEGA
jgi:hypothetical protein